MTKKPGGLIIHINGWPGTGKLTIARHLAQKLAARLLDNHTLMNPAAALFSRSDALYASLRREIRKLTFEHIGRAEPGGTFIFTDALADEDPEREIFDDYRKLAKVRDAELVAIVLDCAREENLKRLTAQGRAEAHKLTDQAILTDLRSRYSLLRSTADRLIELDVTTISATDAAEAILQSLRI